LKTRREISSKTAGKNGEDRAAAFLEAAGFHIIERNVRSGAGEIDIVAIDHDVLVFAEVKAWAAYPIEDLEYSVNKKKTAKNNRNL
jgi:putative endonuclease